MQKAIINVNGQITSPEKAQISIFDRGFLYGDSLYEVIRGYGPQLFSLKEHLDRLQKSAALCQMSLCQSLDHYENEIQRTLEEFRKTQENQNTDVYVRIIVTRGTGKIGFGLQCLTSPTQYIIIIQSLDLGGLQNFERGERGMKLKIVDRIRNDRRALDPALKSGNYLNSLLAYLEANSIGFDDALLCNSEGHLTEGTTFNIFYVRNGIIATPPLDVGILDGITRRHIIQLARNNGIEVREVRFPPQRLYEADEVFISSTIREVFPVSQVDQFKINHGKPGSITLKLNKDFKQIIGRNL